MSASPTPNGSHQESAPAPGQAAGGRAETGDCPKDIDVHDLGNILVGEVRAGNVSSGHIRHLPGGHVELCFRLTDGSQYPQGKRALPLAADWMLEHRVLSRRGFIELYPLAHNSASLHDRALRILERRGLIVKDHGVWVWVDRQ